MSGGNRNVTRGAPLSYANTTAGRNYPFDRAPASDGRSSTASPNRGAADGARGNWLEPVGSPNSGNRNTSPTDPKSAQSGRTGNARPASTVESATPRTASNDGKGATTRSDPVAANRTPPRRTAIRVKGPAVGSAPYYLSYAVDLPPSLTQGADFLWKDNDVWMGDESSGVKILETPGVHRITVLLVTKDNVEYRGMTTVQVLDRSASASSGALP
ncbi:MAG: hypothetical protein IPK83_05690 [Planctomycetes bacterium]|nr:hypothetical protein [Planctomycetota bacterium]